MTVRRSFASLAVLALALTALWAAAVRPAAAGDQQAKVTLRDVVGATLGTAKLVQKQDGVEFRVKLEAPLSVLRAGFHGFHVHAGSECVAPFTSAGGHYNPGSGSHGGHAGDLPILLVNAGEDGTGYGEARFLTDAFALADVEGRTLIVHDLPDNFGNVPVGGGATQYTPNSTGAGNDTATGLTANTGNAGARVGCGTIAAD